MEIEKYRKAAVSMAEWKSLFDRLSASDSSALSLYDEKFHQYFKLNHSRSSRVYKKHTKADLLKWISNLTEFECFIISEPWCGDSAYSFPMIEWFVEELGGSCQAIYRDKHVDLMDNHLTNGGRSIPKAVFFKEGKYFGEWGPRPEELQELRKEWIASELPSDEVMTRLQKWYNQDQGKQVIKELKALVQ